MKKIAVIGGGLAGSEAAYQISARAPGVTVDLFEMRPVVTTEAHETGDLAELVCSNSLKSESLTTPTGRLKADLLAAGSLLIQTAMECRVPAGQALAVDRELMGAAVTKKLTSRDNLTLHREEIIAIPEGYDQVVIATGPLTSAAMSASLGALVGQQSLYFYDAIAPIVEADSVDPAIAFVADRYGDPGTGDYLNIPMNETEYHTFVDALLAGTTVPYHGFEQGQHFDGCLPIEEIARRGRESLAFGPLKPVGFTDPRTGYRPYAVIQLRKENSEGSAYNLVGFQTKLTYGEQERIFKSTIPGFEDAQFLRFGSLHRNTYINGPEVLNGDLSLKVAPTVRLAGQITGVEGYVESIATGYLAGLFTLAEVTGVPLLAPPPTTTLGTLLAYVTTPRDPYPPTNINFSLLPPLVDKVKRRKERRLKTIERAGDDFAAWILPIQNGPI